MKKTNDTINSTRIYGFTVYKSTQNKSIDISALIDEIESQKNALLNKDTGETIEWCGNLSDLLIMIVDIGSEDFKLEFFKDVRIKEVVENYTIENAKKYINENIQPLLNKETLKSQSKNINKQKRSNVL